MAFSLTQFPLPPITKPINQQKLSTPFITTTVKIRTNNHRFTVIRNATDEQQQQNPTTAESETKQPPQSPDGEISELGAEIKKVIIDRDNNINKDESVLNGVLEVIGRIDCTTFNKVVATTGVVLGVIAGSSVILLIVNVVLAALSDWVFAGRSVQDFFG